MTTHSSILAWRIPRTQESGGFTVHEVAQSQTRLSDLAQHKDFALRVWHKVGAQEMLATIAVVLRGEGAQEGSMASRWQSQDANLRL